MLMPWQPRPWLGDSQASFGTSCCIWIPKLATLTADWGLRPEPTDVLTATTGQAIKVTGNQWPELKEPTIADQLLSGSGMGSLH